MRPARIILPAATVGMVLVILLVALSRLYEETFGDQYEELGSIKLGMSEADVLHRLGEPFRIYDGDDAPENYYVDGYAFNERPITARVYIYLRREAIAYVYIDRNGLVEDVFVGGS